MSVLLVQGYMVEAMTWRDLKKPRRAWTHTEILGASLIVWTMAFMIFVAFSVCSGTY